MNLHRWRQQVSDKARNLPAEKAAWLQAQLSTQHFTVMFDGVEAWSFFTAQVEHAFGDTTEAVFRAMNDSVKPGMSKDEFTFYLRTSQPGIYGKMPVQLWVLGFELFQMRLRLAGRGPDTPNQPPNPEKK